MEEVHFPTKGFSGLTLRTFEPAADRWAIRWINSNDGVVQPPVYGGFDGLLGEFYGDDHDDGRPIKVVFRWFVDPDSPRWEQAFSYDEGATWETNWTMALTRLSGPGT